MSIQNGGHPSDRPGVSSFKLPGIQLSTQERRAALAKVKSQIALHKKSIEVLEKERDELEKDLSLVVYPVLTFPVEITSRIFLQCLPSHGRVAPSPTTAPLLLAQICRHWREAALSTTGLWSSLYLHGGSFRFDNERWRNLLRTWFARTKDSPLSLGLRLNRMASPALLDLVSSYASQIQRLELHMLPEQFQKFRPFLAPFPLLRDLATIHSEDVRNLLIASPLIRELRLLDDSELDFLVDQSLPFLTHLNVTTITAEMFLAILRNFPTLSHLKCSYDPDLFSIPDASTPITFPHLSYFHTNGSSILPLVAFPSLFFLEIGCDAEPDVVQEFIVRSSCTIQHLVISFEDEEELDEIADWLSIFPSIYVLKVTQCAEIALLPVIDYLSSPTLMPSLTDISICSHIMSSNIQSDCYDALCKMLHHRRHPLQAEILRRFHINFKFSFNEDDCSQMWRPGYLATLALEQLVEDGLDLGVSVQSEFDAVEIPVWPATYVLEPEPDFP